MRTDRIRPKYRRSARVEISFACRFGLLAALVALASAGCHRTTVEGTVVDVEGKPLPGVAVHGTRGEAEALTDGLGRYALAFPHGIAGLEFLKNGYTSGHLSLQVTEARRVTARPVVLWHLPHGAGVFLFENYRYRRAVPLQPKPFLRDAKTVQYGLAKLPPLEETARQDPLVIGHRMPVYDVHVDRLQQVKVTSPESGSAEQDAWISDSPMSIELVPVDEPERRLIQIRFAGLLTPGVYAVHWGALDGHPNTDPRIFLFRILDAAQPAEAPETPPETAPKPDQQPKPVSPKPPKEEPPPDTSAADAEADAQSQGW